MTQPTFDLKGLTADQFNMVQQGLAMVQRDAQALSMSLQASAQAQIAAMQTATQASTVPPASEAPTA